MQNFRTSRVGCPFSPQGRSPVVVFFVVIFSAAKWPFAQWACPLPRVVVLAHLTPPLHNRSFFSSPDPSYRDRYTLGPPLAVDHPFFVPAPFVGRQLSRTEFPRAFLNFRGPKPPPPPLALSTTQFLAKLSPEPKPKTGIPPINLHQNSSLGRATPFQSWISSRLPPALKHLLTRTQWRTPSKTHCLVFLSGGRGTGGKTRERDRVAR